MKTLLIPQAILAMLCGIFFLVSSTLYAQNSNQDYTVKFIHQSDLARKDFWTTNKDKQLLFVSRNTEQKLSLESGVAVGIPHNASPNIVFVLPNELDNVSVVLEISSKDDLFQRVPINDLNSSFLKANEIMNHDVALILEGEKTNYIIIK